MDGPLLVLCIVAVFAVVGGILSISTVVSNGRKNIETLEKANESLMETRKKYSAYCEKI